MATVYLYTRVSTDRQAVDTQEHDLIQRFPEGEVIREKASGIKDRPKLKALVAQLEPGDILAVAALDRLGRKLSEILNLVESLEKRGIFLVSLREGADYRTPTGKLIIQVILAVAEMERNLTSERTRATLKMLKDKGVKLGPPPTFDPALYEQAKEMIEVGFSYREVSRELGISKTQLNDMVRSLKEKESRKGKPVDPMATMNAFR